MATTRKKTTLRDRYAQIYPTGKQPPEIKSITFSLLFTPEMVHHVQTKINQPEGLREIRVLCPNCSNRQFDVYQRPHPDRMEDYGSVDVIDVVLGLHEFQHSDWDRNIREHGWVWAGKCRHCNHLIYTSKWKAERGIDLMRRNRP